MKVYKNIEMKNWKLNLKRKKGSNIEVYKLVRMAKVVATTTDNIDNLANVLQMEFIRKRQLLSKE